MIVVSQLIRLSEVLVTFGLSVENILLPFLFIMVPFLAFTIPIAYMFAVLIGFSRLSSDGEFTAMLAAGYSLKRAQVPVIGLGVFLFGVAALCATHLESWGRRETVSFYHRKTETELDNMIKYRMKPGVFLNDFLGYVLYAEKISKDRTRFDNVMLAPGAGRSSERFNLLAPSASIKGSVESGNLRMSFNYGVVYSAGATDENVSVVRFRRAELDILRVFQEQIFGPDQVKDDYRSFTANQLWNYIDSFEGTQNEEERKTFYKARFLFHQRLGMPFAAVSFAFFAMVLGITDQRRGKGMGYVGTILAIIGTYVVFMGFKWLAEKGIIAAPLAAWIPNLLGLFFGMFLVYQKNRLPPSESTLDPRFIPGVSRLVKLLNR